MKPIGPSSWANGDGFTFFPDLLYITGMSVLLAYMSYTMCIPKLTEVPRSVVTGGCKLPREYWKLNLGPLQEQQAPLITHPTLQPENVFNTRNYDACCFPQQLGTWTCPVLNWWLCFCSQTLTETVSEIDYRMHPLYRNYQHLWEMWYGTKLVVPRKERERYVTALVLASARSLIISR